MSERQIEAAAKVLYRQRGKRLGVNVDWWSGCTVQAGFREDATEVLEAAHTTVTTEEELDALAVGSIVLDGDGSPDTAHRFREGWRFVVHEDKGEAWLSGPMEVTLPATVLHWGSGE